jgi:hypothetical protein
MSKSKLAHVIVAFLPLLAFTPISSLIPSSRINPVHTHRGVLKLPSSSSTRLASLADLQKREQNEERAAVDALDRRVCFDSKYRWTIS